MTDIQAPWENTVAPAPASLGAVPAQIHITVDM